MTERNTLPLDEDLAAACDAAATELLAMTFAAGAYGLTLPQALAGFVDQANIVESARSCGYIGRGATTRRARHLMFAEGVKQAPKRRTRAQERMDDARAFGLVRGAA